mgnify:CR=1 FL=1
MMKKLRIISILLLFFISESNLYSQDWANTLQFKEANLKAGPPVSGESRVVFMGNSKTKVWLKFFPDFFEV